MYKRLLHLHERILILALLMTGILTLWFAPCKGHDTDYWLYRIYSIWQELITQGLTKYPYEIYTKSFLGYGYPAPLFYGDIFFLFPAALLAKGISIESCFKITEIFIWLLHFGMAYFAAFLFGENGMKREDARSNRRDVGLLFAFLYAFSPYVLETLRVRSALGEAIAQGFLPMVAVCLWLIVNRENVQNKIYIILGVSCAGIAVSHTITTFLVMVFGGGYLLLNCRKLLGKWEKAGKLTGSLLLTGGLSAFFVGPFLEQFLRGVRPTVAGFEKCGLTWRSYFVPYALSKNFRSGIDGWWPDLFFFLTLLGAVLWVLFGKYILNKTVKRCFVLTWVILILISARPTILLLLGKVFGFIQFPWRLLGLISLFTAIFLTYVVVRVDRTAVTACVIIVYCICAFLATGMRAIIDLRTYEPWLYAGAVYGDSIYLPTGTIKEVCEFRGETVEVSDSGVRYEWSREMDGIHFHFERENEENVVTAIFPLYYVYGYAAYDVQKDCYLDVLKSEELKLVQLELPNEPHGDIVVAYYGTHIQKISKWISVCTVFIILSYGVWALCRKREKN